MAITQVGLSDATSGLSVSNTTGLNRTRSAGAIGNLIVVSGFTNGITNPLLISDTQGNTWNVALAAVTDSTNATRYAVWYALAKNTASTTITVKGTVAGTSFWGMTLDEFTGTDTTTPLDQITTSPAGASGTNITTPGITLGFSDCLVWSLLIDTVTGVGNIDGSAATKGSDDGNKDWTEFRVLTGRSGVSVTASWTSSGGYDAVIANFTPPRAAARRFLLIRH